MSLTIRRPMMAAFIVALVIGLVGACPDPGAPGSGGWKKVNSTAVR